MREDWSVALEDSFEGAREVLRLVIRMTFTAYASLRIYSDSDSVKRFSCETIFHRYFHFIGIISVAANILVQSICTRRCTTDKSE